MTPHPSPNEDVSARPRAHLGGAPRPQTRLGAARLGTIGIGIAAICATIVLTGCGTPGTTYAALERPATSADDVPTDLPAYAFDNADPASARSVGKHDGTSLWLLKGADQGICLLSYVDAATWLVGCSGDTGVTTSGTTGHFQVVPDGAVAPESATRVSENVYATE